eukprot:scaffold16664_cov161-Amphora_coffeaeformis.AAC.2
MIAILLFSLISNPNARCLPCATLDICLEDDASYTPTEDAAQNKNNTGSIPRLYGWEDYLQHALYALQDRSYPCPFHVVRANENEKTLIRFQKAW